MTRRPIILSAILYSLFFSIANIKAGHSTNGENTNNSRLEPPTKTSENNATNFTWVATTYNVPRNSNSVAATIYFSDVNNLPRHLSQKSEISQNKQFKKYLEKIHKPYFKIILKLTPQNDGKKVKIHSPKDTEIKEVYLKKIKQDTMDDFSHYFNNKGRPAKQNTGAPSLSKITLLNPRMKTVKESSSH